LKVIPKLEAELATLSDELSNAIAEAEKFQRDRPAVLLSGSDEDLRALDEALARAQRTRERTEARRDDCSRRLEAARDEAAAAELADALASADKAAAAAVAAIRKSLASMARSACELAATVDKAQDMVDRANRLAGDSAEPVAGIDARIAEDRRLPLEILSEETSEKWVYESTGAIIAEQDRVTERPDGRGILYVVSHMGTKAHPAVRCRFVTRTFLPAIDRGYDRSIAEILDGLADLTTLAVQDTRSPQTEVIPA
jgi:SpoVK/Ycf46/Vps4 family AAA+-type ATPase